MRVRAAFIHSRSALIVRALALVCVLLPVTRAAAVEVAVKPDLVYGHKDGLAMTLDVLTPKRGANGAAILYMVSGGFFSSHDSINGRSYAPFLERGYTVFAIVHGSQPKFQIPEITQDIHRAVRFVRLNAKRWGVDPTKFGITGGSAGGHLSLTMGTQGKPGKPDAKDPVDRESSAVQAVACFFPPTDFLNWGSAGDDAVGVGTLKSFQPAFGTNSATAESRQKLGRQISPIYFVTATTAPTLITHGDADKLVPLYQAEVFAKKCQEAGATCKVIVKPGADHGWAGMDKDMGVFADWFDEHLRGIKAKAP